MANDTAAPAKGGKLGLVVWVVIGLVAAGAGGALPWLWPHHEPAPAAAKVPEAQAHKPAVVPFGDVVVNLGEERLTRYLRVKILLVVEEAEAKEAGELLNKQKAFLKSWLIGYLSDQTLGEVMRAVGVNRIRREIRDQFNAMLYPDGAERIHDVLFDEFVVQ